MKRLQGGKVVDYDPFTEPVHATERPAERLILALLDPMTVSEVLEWVGDDPDRAATALKAELAKDAPRSTLVDKLS